MRALVGMFSQYPKLFSGYFVSLEFEDPVMPTATEVTTPHALGS